ncbi:amidohydrolase family protein [Archangium sp.]|uniref:amidohydrolase family protein n=1 Tax=Archangium sp. TaxID=1872627 RepID=UPI00389AC065
MHAHDDDSPVCLGAASGWLAPGQSVLPLPALNDEEGPRLPEGLPPVVDAHVHLFPDGVFEAVWRWFDQYGWPIRYKLHTPQVVSFLLSRGVHRVVALHYAHKPGMARFLNSYVAEVARAEPRVLGLATVLPGEEGAAEILAEAFAAGLKGVKLHCHVQCFAPDAPALHEVYAACARAGRPLVMHAGREPASPQYKCDVHALCSAERVERVLKDHPGLELCVPHLGADEFDAYERLLERYDNLWLDTTMAVANYFPMPLPVRLLHVRPERILYGTDFPNIPYAWDRELKQLLALKLGDEVEAGILGGNALGLFEGC